MYVVVKLTTELAASKLDCVHYQEVGKERPDIHNHTYFCIYAGQLLRGNFEHTSADFIFNPRVLLQRLGEMSLLPLYFRESHQNPYCWQSFHFLSPVSAPLYPPTPAPPPKKNRRKNPPALLAALYDTTTSPAAVAAAAAVAAELGSRGVLV